MAHALLVTVKPIKSTIVSWRLEPAVVILVVILMPLTHAAATAAAATAAAAAASTAFYLDACALACLVAFRTCPPRALGTALALEGAGIHGRRHHAWKRLRCWIGLLPNAFVISWWAPVALPGKLPSQVFVDGSLAQMPVKSNNLALRIPIGEIRQGNGWRTGIVRAAVLQVTWLEGVFPGRSPPCRVTFAHDGTCKQRFLGRAKANPIISVATKIQHIIQWHRHHAQQPHSSPRLFWCFVADNPVQILHAPHVEAVGRQQLSACNRKCHGALTLIDRAAVHEHLCACP